MAVGLFNRAPVPMPVSVKFTDIGLAGNQAVRLLWPQKDLPTDANNVYEAPRRGTGRS